MNELVTRCVSHMQLEVGNFNIPLFYCSSSFGVCVFIIVGLIFQFTMGKGLENNIKFWKKAYVPLDQRESKEWDIRFDLTEDMTITSIVESAKANESKMLYCLISGIEFGKSRNDRPMQGRWITQEDTLHVHIALILHNKSTRPEVLKLFRPTRQGGQYCVPRNTNHTYIGWRLHHNKDATKVAGAAPVLEFGTLPMDPLNEANAAKVYNMLRQYGSPSDTERYATYRNMHLSIRKLENKRKGQEVVQELEELRKKVSKTE